MDYPDIHKKGTCLVEARNSRIECLNRLTKRYSKRPIMLKQPMACGIPRYYHIYLYVTMPPMGVDYLFPLPLGYFSV